MQRFSRVSNHESISPLLSSKRAIIHKASTFSGSDLSICSSSLLALAGSPFDKALDALFNFECIGCFLNGRFIQIIFYPKKNGPKSVFFCFKRFLQLISKFTVHKSTQSVIEIGYRVSIRRQCSSHERWLFIKNVIDTNPESCVIVF